MTEQEEGAQLEWERRAAPRAAAAAFAAVVMVIAAFVVSAAAVGSDEDSLDRIMSIDDSSFGYLLTGVFQALGLALLAPVLYYLYRATRARRPELPASVRILVLLGPLVAAGVTIVFQVDRVDAIGDYLAGDSVTEDGAEDVLREGGSDLLPGFGFAANLAVALAIVLISLSAMRVGLLSRFIGILGVAVGAFTALPLFGAPVVLQLFWLAALGTLFLDRWPGGRGPAWASVEAIPWPTTADRLEAERRRQEAREPAGAQAEQPAAPAPRPASRKRRRGR